MKQLLLNLAAIPEPSFANFAVGKNHELTALLAMLARGDNRERFVYIWGEKGAGKSHLLRALTAALASPPRSLGGAASVPEIGAIAADETVLFDDVDRISSASQPALFHAYNRLRTGRGRLIATGGVPPAHLTLLADLKSRLAWGMVMQVHSLSDEEKLNTLEQHATERGFKLSPEVIRYIFLHQSRDLPSLIQLLAALDQYSLETKRAITVPLLKEVLDNNSFAES